MSRKENVMLRQVGLGSKSHDLNEFSVSEEALIFEVFAGIILRKSFEPCSSRTIQSKLVEFAAGKRILEKFGTKKLVNKIKYYKKREASGKNAYIKSYIAANQSEVTLDG